MVEDLITTSDIGQLRVIQLNRPKALNALNLSMFQQLKLTLEDAFAADTIRTIWLESSQMKAFCAGGDVKAVVGKIMEASNEDERGAFGAEYFGLEYSIDLMIEQSPKPIIIFAQGFTFGGGWGLFAGGNLKLASQSSKFAMPENQIGLFPDVGAGHFLQKHDWKIGTFLAISGITLSAIEAMALDYVDDIISEDYAQTLKTQLSQGIDATELDIDSSADDEGQIIQSWHEAMALLPDDGTLTDWMSIAESNQQFDQFAKAAHSWQTASMWSVALSWHYFQQVRNQSREQVLNSDLLVGSNACMHAEFVEGVRAKLIEKDNEPKWLYPHVESVPYEDIKNMLGLTENN